MHVSVFHPQMRDALPSCKPWSCPIWQELQNAHRDSGGQIPRTIEVELKEDLVDSCTAGDVVTVVGIVKVVNTEIVPGVLRPVS